MSDEWGPVYSGVMTDCIEATRPAHDRMLALPYFEEYGIWLSGTFDDAASFQSGCFPDELIEMTRIDEFWVKSRVIPDTEAVVIRGRSDPPRSEMVQLITGEFEGKTKTHIEILQLSHKRIRPPSKRKVRFEAMEPGDTTDLKALNSGENSGSVPGDLTWAIIRRFEISLDLRR